ncbi:hypothetical protein ACQJBY_053260 [Aegilops geniculata]
MDLDMDVLFGDATAGRHSMQVLDARPMAMAGPVESQASINIAEAEVCRVEDRALVRESVGFPPEEGDFNVCSEATSSWTRRVRIGEALYKTFAHEVDVIEHRKVYKVTHLDAAAREKWSKVVFIVNVEVCLQAELAGGMQSIFYMQ